MPTTGRRTPSGGAAGRLPFVASRVQSLVLAAAGGLLTETAFPEKSWWWMAYVGIALLVVALSRDSVRWGAVVGFVFGLGLFVPHLWWANEAVGQPIGWIALSTAEAAAIAVFGASLVLVRRLPVVGMRPWLECAVAALLWVAVEHLRARFPFGGFPWATLAYSQTDAPLLRLAPIGGTTLVSLVVVLVGAALGRLLVHARGRPGRRGWTVAGLLVLTISAPLLIPLGTQAESGVLRVGAVQGNVPTQGAEAFSQARAVLDNHAAGTRALVEQVGPGELDLILWPESASDIDPRTDRRAEAVVERTASAAQAPILLGTQRFLDDTRYNDYILWQASRGSTATYTKQHPVPFGEYIPYRDFFRRLSPAVDLIGTDMSAGTEAGPLSVPIERLARSVPISTAICFEVAYDDLIRTSVLAGGELIVIPTNNASFGMTQESTQQLAMSRFRAAEHGRAVVQISTVGVSALIAPDGSLLDRTSLFTAAQMADELPLRTSITLSDRIGERLALAVDGAAVLLLGAALVVAVRTRLAPTATRTPGVR